MAFEARKAGGTKYLYLSRRDPRTGRVTKTYVGTGPEADAAAAELAARRQHRRAERLAVERSEAELRLADALTAELDAAATVLMAAALVAAGFHQTNYGPWRRRRRDHGGGDADPAGGAG